MPWMVHIWSGPNDQAMAEPSNPVSNGINWVVNQGMDLLGYNTRRRDPSEDNPFYRDNAQFMPGWSMPGSGFFYRRGVCRIERQIMSATRSPKRPRRHQRMGQCSAQFGANRKATEFTNVNPKAGQAALVLGICTART